MTAKIEQVFASIQATLNAIREDNEASNRRREILGKNVWTTAEVALALGVTEDRVRHMVSDREIPHYKHNGKNLFKRVEIEQWQTSKRVASKDEYTSQAAVYCLGK